MLKRILIDVLKVGNVFAGGGSSIAGLVHRSYPMPFPLSSGVGWSSAVMYHLAQSSAEEG